MTRKRQLVSQAELDRMHQLAQELIAKECPVRHPSKLLLCELERGHHGQHYARNKWNLMGYWWDEG